MTKKEQVFSFLQDNPEIAELQTSDGADEIRRRLDPELADSTLRRYIREWRSQGDAPGSEADAKVDAKVEPESKRPEVLKAANERLHYNAGDDVYIWFARSYTKPQIIDGKLFRRMKEAYSNWDGDESSINEVIREFEISRPDFIALKADAGWTHDSSPYSDEEIIEEDETTLVRDLVRRKEQAIYRKYQKEQWKRTEREADKYRKMKAGILEPLADFIADNPPRSKRDVVNIAVDQGEFMAIFSPSDAHIGKLGVDGYSVELARELLIETTERLVARVARFGRPSRNVLVLGNDWMHVDNTGRTTTAGTPQDLDGTFAGMTCSAYDIAVEVIDRLRVLGPLEVFVVESNHDASMMHAFGHGLRTAYRLAGANDVKVYPCDSPRHYLRFGRNLVGLEHGDGPKEKDLPIIMAKEQRKAWGETSHRYWITGHLHHLVEKDFGATVMRAPSISGKDRWHDKNGYVTADRANICYLFDYNEGHTDRMLALVDEDSAKIRVVDHNPDARRATA